MSNENTLQTDLTEGSVAKQLVRYTLPLVTTSILQSVYSLVDTFVAGHFIGNAALSAINNASAVILLMTNIAIGLTTGANAIMGQFFGSKDEKNCHQAMGTTFTFCAIAGLICALGFFLLSRPLLTLMGAPALDDSSIYLQICSIGLFFTFGYNALTAALRAVGNSKKPMHFVAIATAINVVLDLLFVAVFRWGIAGAAIATVISQAISCLLALLFFMKHKEFFTFTLENLKMHADKLRIILKTGIPTAIQMTAAGLSWIVVTSLINGHGLDVSAGAGISSKIRDFCLLFTTTMSNGTGTMIAQTLGARKFDRAKEVMYTAAKLTLCVAGVIVILVEIFAPQLIGLFNSDPVVVGYGVMNIRIEIIGQLFYVFFIFHSLAIGAGHGWFVLGSTFFNSIVVRVILSITLNHFFGLTGLFVACALAPASSLPLCFFYIKSNIWQKKLITDEIR